MLRYLSVLILALSFAVSGTSKASEMRAESVYSKGLGRDLKYQVYVPAGYDQSRLHYPVLYLLHGAGGSETDWQERGLIQTQVDTLIQSGKIPPTLIVMPGCADCWWVDGAKEKAETAFWQELVPTVDARFRTIEAREGRLLAGLSAGGFGVVHFAMRHPDQVAAAAALSPAIYSTTPPANSCARTSEQFLKADGSFDQKFWAEQNYPHFIDRYLAQRYRVPFYLVSGDHDELGIAYETALLFKRLWAEQPSITELRIVDGSHAWALWEQQIDEALTYLYRFAAKPQLIEAGDLQKAASTRSKVTSLLGSLAHTQ